jgi:hypothetical protein
MPSDVIKGRRCRKCSFKRMQKTNEEWLTQVGHLTGNDYKFLEPYKGDGSKIKYLHICGETHSVTPNNFINGTRCPRCKESAGEAHIRMVLTERKIKYLPQYVLPELKGKNPLRYDFYLPEHNMLIEFQGQQHYKPVGIFGGQQAFESQVKRDELKRKFARKQGMILVEIPFTVDSVTEMRVALGSTIPSSTNCNVKQGTQNEQTGL